jgi:ABC-type lipoprotein release transport system permease subunit
VPERHILLTIATQAGAIINAAWFVGLLVSTHMGALINGTVAPQYGLESLYAADAKLLGLVFVLAASVGIVSGIRPARQATRIDPVLVLREA